MNDRFGGGGLRVALRKKGDHWYGDGPTDVWDYFVQWTRDGGRPVTHWKQAVCSCGSTVFQVDFDEDEQYLERYCTECAVGVVMFADEFADSATSAEDVELNPALLECICGRNRFEVVGATMPFPDDPEGVSAHTFYLGLRCLHCGCLGCYTSWHPRYKHHEAFLAML